MTVDKTMTEPNWMEFEHRVTERLAEWNASYVAMDTVCASPLMDRIMAEKEVRAEMAAEQKGDDRE